ncbi:MAG: twin transmembrane helix small protein [Acetobacteraceae bacterium]
MRLFGSILIGIMMLATLGVLIVGVIGMLRPDHDPRRSNQLMRWRVLLQAAALLLMVLFASMLRG